MHGIGWRRWVAAGAVAAMLLVLGTSFAPAAQADGPSQSGVRIHRTTEWFAQHADANAAHGRPGANNLQYYGGQVMLTAHNYTIYWAPSGHAIDAGYQSLINRYFSDVGGSTFYNIVTQYYQNPGTQFIQNNSTLAGTIVDTTAYPGGRGTAANPLTDADIQQEVANVASAHNWPADNSTQYFVYTAPGIESCYDPSTCTPGTAHPAFCAYHGLTALISGKQYIYANMPYDETWTTSCRSFSKSPNGNIAADSEISVTSHEQFEAVTDLNPPPTTPNPPITAWTDSAGYEIGDKCAYKYGRTARDGSNLTLNGHPYIAQLEWSNAASGCAKSY